MPIPKPKIKHRKDEASRRIQIGGLYLDRDVWEYATRQGNRSEWIRKACRLVMEAEQGR